MNIPKFPGKRKEKYISSLNRRKNFLVAFTVCTVWWGLFFTPSATTSGLSSLKACLPFETKLPTTVEVEKDSEKNLSSRHTS